MTVNQGCPHLFGMRAISKTTSSKECKYLAPLAIKK